MPAKSTLQIMARPMVHRWKESDLIPLREKSDEQYQPDEIELTEYASHLGIEKEEIVVKELLELAYEGIRAKLPSGWQALITPDESIVYRNTTTRQLFEQHPMDQIFRQRVVDMKRLLAEGSENESVVRSELSSISQDENQFKNQSDIYDRRRYDAPHAARNLLREPITSQNFKHIIEEESHSVQNSLLNRNLSSKEDGSVGQGGLDTKMSKLLPSSLLKETPSMPMQGTLEQYMTVMTQVEKPWEDEQSKQSNVSDGSKLQALRAELEELSKQQNLKQALLQQIKQSNQQKMDKLKRHLRLKI